MTGADEPGKPKGYMLAALARSHKSDIGKFAETTEIYLKDARFCGYSPEFIIRQMFERGIFSFIPAALLEIYTGEAYVKLPIISQTRLIGELGLSANQVDELIETASHCKVASIAKFHFPDGFILRRDYFLIKIPAACIKSTVSIVTIRYKSFAVNIIKVRFLQQQQIGRAHV